MHEQGIAHRDLKPENIIFIQEDDGSATLKMCVIHRFILSLMGRIDFGFAKNCTDNSPMYGAAGTLGYKGSPFIFLFIPDSQRLRSSAINHIQPKLICGA